MEMKVKDMTKEARRVLNHLVVLYDEIDVLKSRVERHDTGHIKVAISVLKERVNEIKAELLSLD